MDPRAQGGIPEKGGVKSLNRMIWEGQEIPDRTKYMMTKLLSPNLRVTLLQWTEVIHTKAHTNQVNLSSMLNYEADHYASQSQKCTNSLHPAPVPTFYMDNFTFYRPLDGWIESNIWTLIEHSMTHSTLLELTKKHCYHMALWLYDPHPLPAYPYVKATSAYSAAVQWYARSGQLPTADGMRTKGQGDDN
jgi:hypothetical protein